MFLILVKKIVLLCLNWTLYIMFKRKSNNVLNNYFKYNVSKSKILFLDIFLLAKDAQNYLQLHLKQQYLTNFVRAQINHTDRL